ncbi:MAG: diguanylate cyclase [Thermoguttaceae bacterium]
MESHIDIFEREQVILNRALEHCAAFESGASCSPDEYRGLTREYEKMLRQLRRITKLSDNASNTLNTSKIDLMDRVHYDALTGIFNRRYLEDNLVRVIKTVARSASNISLLFLDVDFFKKYNDYYGHAKGDECLKAVARVMSETVSRADDFVARYGGEEFVVVLPNTDETGARLIASRILDNVRELKMPHETSDVSECVTVSIGVTSSVADFHQSPADFLRRADTALYAAKREGRNRYMFIDMEEVIK